MEITVQRIISMGHRLPSYKGICSSPHGHNIRVTAVLETNQFVDFKTVSDDLGKILEPLDHAMVLLSDDPVAKFLAEQGFRVFGLSVEPTTENVATLIFNVMVGLYQTELLSITVHETDKYSATARMPRPSIHRVPILQD